MEIIKKILYIICITSLFSCNSQDHKINQNNELDTSDSQNETIDFTMQRLVSKDENTFEYSNGDRVYRLIPTENFNYNLSINDRLFQTNLSLESASVNIWDFKQTNEHVILVEGDDYYSSVFYIYVDDGNELSCYGNFNYIVKNAEQNNPNKKFTIRRKNQDLQITISQGDVKNSHDFHTFQTVPLISRHSANDNSLKNELEQDNREMVKDLKADINQDGIQDKIYVIWNKTNENFLVWIAISDKELNREKVFKNQHLLTLPNANSTGIGLIDIVIKNNYITFEDNVKEGNPTQNKYITFVYNQDERQLYLHKYGITATFDDDNSEKDWEHIYSVKDFGKIKFEDFNSETMDDQIH